MRTSRIWIRFSRKVIRGGGRKRSRKSNKRRMTCCQRMNNRKRGLKSCRVWRTNWHRARKIRNWRLLSCRKNRRTIGRTFLKKHRTEWTCSSCWLPRFPFCRFHSQPSWRGYFVCFCAFFGGASADSPRIDEFLIWVLVTAFKVCQLILHWCGHTHDVECSDRNNTQQHNNTRTHNNTQHTTTHNTHEHNNTTTTTTHNNNNNNTTTNNNNHNNNNLERLRFNRRGASTPLWGVEACFFPSRRPNPIPAIPPYVVRTPQLHGAPTTEETVKLWYWCSQWNIFGRNTRKKKRRNYFPLKNGKKEKD